MLWANLQQNDKQLFMYLSARNISKIVKFCFVTPPPFRKFINSLLKRNPFPRREEECYRMYQLNLEEKQNIRRTCYSKAKAQSHSIAFDISHQTAVLFRLGSECINPKKPTS